MENVTRDEGFGMAFVCWRTLDENPWVGLPMQAVLPHVPPRPRATPGAPGMFAFADPQRIAEILTGAGWAAPRIDKLNLELDFAAGHGLDEAVVQSTRIGTVNSWLRNQPEENVSAAIASIREVLSPHLAGATMPLPGAISLVSSSA